MQRWVVSSSWRAALGVVLGLACMTPVGDARAQVQASDDGAARAIETLEREVGVGLVLRRSGGASVASFLRTRRGVAIDSGAPFGAPADRRARAFLERHGAAVGVDDVAQFVTERTRLDAVGMVHVRLQQTHDGLRVRGAELGVHLRGPGVVAINGRALRDLTRLETAPTLNASQVLVEVTRLLADAYDRVPAQLSAPALEIFDPAAFDGVEAPPRLAWYVEAGAEALRLSVWVDAHDGAILLHFNALPTVRNRFIHDAMDSDVVPGTLVRSEGQPATGDPEIDDSYDFTGDTYDYFFTAHGRNSYDGAGAPMRSSVRYCSASSGCIISCPCSNAFWFGTFGVFGALKHDDIVGHEFTHGVVDHSAGLIYLNQSGALNESFADIFGETIDLTNGAGLDTPAVRWLIEEDLLPSTGIRNMSDPTLGWPAADPGKMTDPQLVCTSEDSGGVHSNSGIGNHAYALMVDGGTYNGRAINGIGLDKAGKIEYRALTSYLLASSTYLDHYDALQQACDDLIGTAGISAADCLAVRQAAEAVEMHLPWQCNCGNGSLDVGEECDDGNQFGGDGCSAVCLIPAPQTPSTGWIGWASVAATLAMVGSLALSRRSPVGSGWPFGRAPR